MRATDSTVYCDVPEMNLIPIGTNCYFNALSSALEYLDQFDYVLTLTTYDFLYKDSTSFSSLSIESDITKYISKSNPLIFDIRPHSIFLNTIYHLRDNMTDHTKGLDVIELQWPEADEFEEICQQYLERKIPLLLNVNVSLLKDEYAAIGAHLPRGSESIHLVNLFKIYGKVGWIVDTQFRANGFISLEALKRAVYAVKSPCIYAVELKQPIPSTETLLKRHVQNSLKDKTIDGNIYKVSDTMTRFTGDIEEILCMLDQRYDIYAHAVFSYLLNAHRLERRGCGVLYRKIAVKCQSKAWDIIAKNAEDSGRLWYLLDEQVDKSFLHGRRITSTIDIARKICKKIEEADSQVYEQMKAWYITHGGENL